MITQCQWCHCYLEVEENPSKEIECSFCHKKTTLVSLPSLGILDTKTETALQQISQKIHRLWWAILLSWVVGILALFFSIWR